MESRPALFELQRMFVLPPELGASRPRDVRLTAGGKALLAVAVALFVASVGVGIGMSRAADRQVRQQRIFAAEGIDAHGDVVRLWRGSGKDQTRWVSYRYAVEGRTYEGRTKIGSSAWRALQVGATLPVRYVRSDPGWSRAAGVQPKAMPLWLPFVVGGVLAIVGWLCAGLIRGQRRLLAEGRAVPAIVTGRTLHRTQYGTQQSITYTFQLLSGATAEGRSGPSSKPPAVGSVICVLYDPDRPSRSALYPLQLVRPVGWTSKPQR